LKPEPESHFFMLTYDTQKQRWETQYLSDDRTEDLVQFRSDSWSNLSEGENTLRWEAHESSLKIVLHISGGASFSGSFERQ